MTPFVTFWTPTFRRPKQLAACIASLDAQTARDRIEQIIVPDFVGLGVAEGLYGRLPLYQDVFHGQYINFLCDDDIMATPTAVEEVEAWARAQNYPDVIVTQVVKNGLTLPLCSPTDEPVCGQVDLTSYLVRADVWKQHVKDYGLIYEGDFTHALAMHQSGRQFAFCPVLWAIGPASRGATEEAA